VAGTAYAFYCSLMGRLDLQVIENQLKKRWAYPEHWFQKQNDLWDSRSNFIYNSPDFENLISSINQEAKLHSLDVQMFFQYAVNRWYNYWSARAVEQIFCDIPGVLPAKNAKDRLVDFSIDGINFDHKTSVFPRGFGKDLAFAKANLTALINWLYANQSTGKRYHRSNRLFLVVFKKDGRHYQLKAEISWLQKLIADYVSTFDSSKLVAVSTPDQKTAFSDIIWAVR